MKIVIITQNEPFYLAKNISYLYKLISKDIEIAGVILYEPSPFGRKESLLRNLSELKSLTTKQLRDRRYQKFRKIGKFLEPSSLNEELIN